MSDCLRGVGAIGGFLNVTSGSVYRLRRTGFLPVEPTRPISLDVGSATALRDVILPARRSAARRQAAAARWHEPFRLAGDERD